MLVYLLYMLVFLAKEEQILSQQVSPEYVGFTSGSDVFPPSSFLLFFLFNLQDSPLFSLLVQSTSLPWHQLDQSSYQGILGYVSTHYPPSLLLTADSAPQLLLKSLRSAAGLHPRPNEVPHRVRQRSIVGFTNQITDLLSHPEPLKVSSELQLQFINPRVFNNEETSKSELVSESMQPKNPSPPFMPPSKVTPPKTPEHALTDCC